MSQRSIEVKVGVLILVALILLGGFIVVMGGLSFEPTYTIYVDFENPGALQSGAPVRLAGMQVGKVSEVQFRGGEVDPKTNEPVPPIRVVAKIEKRYQTAIRANARWYVTTHGVLGEQFLAVEPGTTKFPVLWDGAIVHGVSPPRLDLLLSEGYELLHKAYQGVSGNEQKIEETFDGLHATLTGTGAFFKNNRDKLDSIVSNTEAFSVEANDTIREARERFVTGPQVNRIMNNLERTTAAVNEGLPPVFDDSRKVLADLHRLSQTLASPEQLARYEQITRDVSAAAGDGKVAMREARTVVGHVRAGRGSVGALVMDEAVYDDLQEMLRDLKHNPWKFFWRE